MIQGEIQTFPLPDLIQWLALTRRTGHLSITQAEHRMEIFFADGLIASTSHSEIVGPDNPEKARAVLASALAWRNGYFVFEEGAPPTQVAASEMRLSVEPLLLDAARAFDEERKHSATDAARLEETDDDAFAIADELRLRIVDHLLRGDFRVPPMPHLATRVLEMTRTDFSTRDLGNLIMTDQAVAAQILRYANSAMGGAERRVETLPLALQRLGTDEVVNIVLALSLYAKRPGPDIFAEEKRRLRAHSNLTAFVAHSIAARVRLDPNLAFLCGLLIDFGKSVLYSLIQDLLEGGFAPAKVVAEIVRDYNQRVGRVVAEKWQLPSAVVESIANRRSVEGATIDREYVCVTALADSLATSALELPRGELEEASTRNPPESLSEHPAGRIIKLSSEKAALVLRDLPLQVDKALQFVST